MARVGPNVAIDRSDGCLHLRHSSALSNILACVAATRWILEQSEQGHINCFSWEMSVELCSYFKPIIIKSEESRVFCKAGNQWRSLLIVLWSAYLRI